MISLPSTGSGNSPAPVVFETRVIPTAGRASVILPYVLDALRAIGSGTAVAVGVDAIQLTAAVDFSTNLIAVIQDYAKQANPPADIPSPKFFDPPIAVPVKQIPDPDGKRLVDVIRGLALCPPDMQIQFLATQTAGAGSNLVFSGLADRESFYKSFVLPQVQKIVDLL